MQKIRDFWADIYIRNTIIAFLIVVLLATVLRFYKLGEVPHGMTWDEAAIGYNGFAILHTRRDEWLTKLPVSFKSFGDYKSPLAIYLNGPFTFILGMTAFGVRFPFAVAGVLSVIGVFFLGYQLGKETFSDLGSVGFGFILAFLMTFSPWHINFSRVGFESGLALCMIIWGIVFLFAALNRNDVESRIQKMTRNGMLGLSVILFVSSFYTYHSAKIVTPLLLLSLVILLWYKIKVQLKFILGGAILGVVLLIPLVKDTFLGNGGARFSQATVFGQHYTPSQLVQSLFSHLIAQFSPAYLLFGQTVTLRHGDGHWGILYITDFILIICALMFLLLHIFSFYQKRFKKFRLDYWREILFALSWTVIGTIPAVIGTDVPHQNRALLALPGFLLLSYYGLDALIHYLHGTKLEKSLSGSKGEKRLLVKSVSGCFLLFHLFFAASYLHDYYTVFAKESANDFQDGFVEAFKYAVQNEPTSDQIIISDKYGQAYIFALFVRQTNPIWYQGGIMVKYLYLPKVNEGDLNRKNTVIIATPDQIDPKYADKLVYGSDGQIKFVLIKTK